MSLEFWTTNQDGKKGPQPVLEEDIDKLNDETFGDDITGDWEAHHYSSVLEEEQGKVTPPTTRGDEPWREKEDGCIGSKDEADNIAQFEKLGLKDLWDSSPNMSSPLESIWTPSALPHPQTVDKITSPAHSQGSSASGKVSMVNVADLEKTMMESASLSSPPHSPGALHLSFPTVHSPLSHSPSPPPPPFMSRPHPPPHPLIMYPPPGLHMVRPHPHQLAPPLMPQARVPPYFGRGPIPPRLHHLAHHLPPNIPLMGPPRMLPGFPQPRPPLLMNPPQMVPRPQYHEGQRPPPRHFPPSSANPASSKLSEMLSDLKPDGSGFMSKKEKDWVIKVQLLQLHTTSPEIDDYYYQKYIHNKYKSDKKEGVVRSGDNPTPLTLPPPISKEDRKDRPRSEFEGTLGKVSVGSVVAPRKTIDVTPLTANEGRKETLSRKRQALVAIETMYGLLLELEDLHTVVSEDDNSHQTRKQVLCDQLFSLLDVSDFQQVMSYRKGKHLLRRLLPCFDEEKSKAILSTFSKNLIPILKKDTQDKILPDLLPALSAVVNICSISEVQSTLVFLQPLLTSKYTNNKFFVEFFGLLVKKGNQFVSSGQQAPEWKPLLSQLNSLFIKSKSKSDILGSLLSSSVN